MISKLNNKKKINIDFKKILIYVALTVLASFPYLNKQTIFSWDLCYHLNRINEIALNLQEGQFPVLIHSHLMENLGYANSIFYPELFLYIPAILKIFGMGSLLSYKIFLMIITFFTFLFMDLTAKKIFKNIKISYLASILYTFSLYRLMDIYVRGALGEVLAIAFFPLLLYGLYDIIFEEGKKWWVLVLGLFGIANSHILSLAFAAFLIIFICVCNIKTILKNATILKKLIKTGIISILICSSVILPILEQYKSVRLKVQSNNSGFNLSEQASTLTSALENDIRFGSSVDGNTIKSAESMSTCVGIMLLLLPGLLLFNKNKEKEKNYKYLLQILALGIVSFILATKIFPWSKFEWMATIQFPWRFNMITALALSLVSSYSVYNFFENKRDSIMILIIGILVMSCCLLQKIDINPLNYNYDQLINYTPIGNGEYLPESINLAVDNSKVVNLENNKNIDFKREKCGLEFNTSESKTYELPLIYYKGYKAYLIDNENKKHKIPVTLDEGRGLAMVNNTTEKQGVIKVKYEMTNVQKISYLVTILSFVVIILENKIKRRK